MKKPIIKKKFKITMLVLLLVAIFSYIGAFFSLYHSNYRLSNYKDEAVKLFGVNGSVFDFSTWFENHSSTNEFISKDLTKDIKNINIHSNASIIRVVKDDKNSNKISVEYSLSGPESVVNSIKKDNIKFKKEGDSLNFNLSNLNSNLSSCSITLYIPTNYNNNINLKTNSGSIYVDSVHLNELNTDVDSGNIDLYNINCNKINIKNKYGDITCNNIKTNNSKFENESGNLHINGYLGDSKVKSNNGNIDIKCTKLGENTEINNENGNIYFGDLNTLNNFDIIAKTELGTISSSNSKITNDKKVTFGKGKSHIIIKNKRGNITF
ncbi:DUF4097 family beta strand repeat-containing protein [Eubacterium multiforme]|uniref:DUF4097 and DUF4098 domain-containing protein YvlB n=1 Tax=Eubacterium multiforme TaxID=83339 RepID=A0ABT9UT08_9FIRM|nr:DUF4097 family beta strand repeat-containing protein [Eubacterium multiforme]MDQ0149478.1 DUF4097 and DUF4098 domain-containing protein YvlB [Eubacterium multiforme]